MSSSLTSSVNRWVSPRWPSWPLSLKINLHHGDCVQVHSVAFAVDDRLTPTAIRVVGGSGYEIGQAEYLPSSDIPQKTLLLCNRPVETTDLELIIAGSYSSFQNPFGQVLIKRLSVAYSTAPTIVRSEESVGKGLDGEGSDEIDEIKDEYAIESILTEPSGSDYHQLQRLCNNCTSRLQKRRQRCQRLQLTKERLRLEQSAGTLSTLLAHAHVLEQDRLLAISTGKVVDADVILERLRELYVQAVAEIEEIESFDPACLSKSEARQLGHELNTASDNETASVVDPYRDLDHASSRMTWSDSDRKRLAKRLYELFGTDSVETLFFSSSETARLRALHRCFTMIRSNISNRSFRSASERLISVAKYDSFFKVREFLLTIAELILDVESLTSFAFHFVCDSYQKIRFDAARILCNIWSVSDDGRSGIWKQLEADVPDDDWSLHLGHCFAVHCLIKSFNCSEQVQGSRVCLSNVMPILVRALQNPHRSVRNAAISICDDLESRLGPSSTEPYLTKIDPLSILSKFEGLAHGTDSSGVDDLAVNDAKPSSILSSNPKTRPSDIIHFLPAAKTSDELLQIWSF